MALKQASRLTVARHIVRDANHEQRFAGRLDLVYDTRTGRRVGDFPGEGWMIREWSEWDPDTMIVLRGAGQGRRWYVDEVLEMLYRSEPEW